MRNRKTDRDLRRQREYRANLSRAGRERRAAIRRATAQLSALLDRADRLTLWERSIVEHAVQAGKAGARDYSQITGPVVAPSLGAADPDGKARRWRDLITGELDARRSLDDSARRFHAEQEAPEVERAQRAELDALIEAETRWIQASDYLPTIAQGALLGDSECAAFWTDLYDLCLRAFGAETALLIDAPPYAVRALARPAPDRAPGPRFDPHVASAGEKAAPDGWPIPTVPSVDLRPVFGPLQPVGAPKYPEPILDRNGGMRPDDRAAKAQAGRLRSAREAVQLAAREPSREHAESALAKLRPIKPEVWNPKDKGELGRIRDRLRRMSR